MITTIYSNLPLSVVERLLKSLAAAYAVNGGKLILSDMACECRYLNKIGRYYYIAIRPNGCEGADTIAGLKARLLSPEAAFMVAHIELLENGNYTLEVRQKLNN